MTGVEESEGTGESSRIVPRFLFVSRMCAKRTVMRVKWIGARDAVTRSLREGQQSDPGLAQAALRSAVSKRRLVSSGRVTLDQHAPSKKGECAFTTAELSGSPPEVDNEKQTSARKKCAPFNTEAAMRIRTRDRRRRRARRGQSLRHPMQSEGGHWP